VNEPDASRPPLDELEREREALRRENAALSEALDEARQAYSALAGGEADADARGGAAPTLLRASQSRLRKSERLSRAIFNGALDAMLLADDRGTLVDVNPAACELFGAARERLMGRKVVECMAPEYDSASARRALLDQGYLRGYVPIVRADGSRREIEFTATANIAPGLHLAVLRDVTERRRADEARSRLAAIVESSEDAILSAALDGTITSWNRSAERLYGHPAREALGRPVTMLAPPDLQPEALEILRHAEQGERIERFETVRSKKDGARIDVSLAVSPIRDDAGRTIGVSQIARDLSEQRRAEAALRQTEEQLRHAQKMEAVGRLAGGVAHDFNNLLSVILSYTDFILEGMDPGDPSRADLAEVQRAGLRATDLTRQLLAFSRRQVLLPKVIDLNGVVLGMEKMLRRMLGEDVLLSLVTAPRPARALVDPGQVEQVLMNLAVNARDAMPTGGRLTIEVAHAELDAAQAAGAGVAPGGYVTVEVTDTGGGMPPEVREHVFEPFFTTKEPGKGTGLGLATVLGIVQQSGGNVSVASEPGRGATFKAYLPGTHRAPSLNTSPPPGARPLRGTETILVVEDEEQVRALLRVILRRNGYRVLEAQNGGEALLAVEQRDAPIDLLLTDVVLPRMSGRQLAERLAPLLPAMRVVFMSGYNDDAVVRHGVLEAGVNFLPKPIVPEALLFSVREALDAD
jgi:two-component system cell cycle sensor histidine kinase/response regulator CckA